MFNLIKRKSEKEIITEIHNEFDTAEDRLLKEATDVLKELNLETESSITQRANRLRSLGFTKSAPVTWVNNSPLIKTRKQAELIQYYKQNYPFQKFLTEDELDKICKKYNLIHAPVSNYIKDVPEKNINEIESVSELKSVDFAKDDVWTKILYGNDVLGISNIKAALLGLPTRIDNFEESHFLYIDNYLRSNYPSVSNRAYICRGGEINKISKQGLFICAPKSHFNLTGLSKTSTFSFKSIIIAEPKDPIVFRYCRGGIQILSKWGLESSDELLVNEINN
jgi:hypothetical protein